MICWNVKYVGANFMQLMKNIIFPVIIRKLVCQQLLAASWKLLYMILMIALLVAVRWQFRRERESILQVNKDLRKEILWSFVKIALIKEKKKTARFIRLWVILRKNVRTLMQAKKCWLQNLIVMKAVCLVETRIVVQSGLALTEARGMII